MQVYAPRSLYEYWMGLHPQFQRREVVGFQKYYLGKHFVNASRPGFISAPLIKWMPDHVGLVKVDSVGIELE